MSLWTEVKGYIEIPKAAHFSVMDSIQETFGDYDLGGKPKIDSLSFLNHSWQYKVSFNYCHDGLNSAKVFDSWVKTLPKGSTLDLSVSIRFVD